MLIKEQQEKQEKKLKDKCLKLLRQYTKHDIVKITSSGDAAIFGALVIAKQHGCNTVLVPDQGGWLTYLSFPKILNMIVIEIKTNYGLIDFEELEKAAKKYSKSAFLFASFAGYAAPQNLEGIYSLCKKYNILMIEDASGSLSHSQLCNGSFSDMIVGSFGKWKIADLGYGGFLSCRDGIITLQIKELNILSLIQEKQMNYGILLKKLQGVTGRLHFLLQKTKEIKALCKKQGFIMIHEDAYGIGIFVKYKDNEEKQRILDFCKNNNIEYKECPLYIKVLENAISLEIKRIH